MDLQPPLDAILFDAGGVLVWPNWNRVAEALRSHGVIADAARLAMAEPHARHALDVDELVKLSTDQRRAEDYFSLVLAYAGVRLSGATARALAEMREYQRTSNLWEHVPEFVVPTLRALKAHGYRMAVLSNANGTVRAAFTRLGLAPYFDAIIDSAEEGLEKPDPRLFELALARVGAAAPETLHVGDMYHVDVVRARAAGIAAVLVDEAGLKNNVDCPCIRSVSELPALLANWGTPSRRVPPS